MTAPCTTWGAPIAKGSDVWPGPGKPVWLGNDVRVGVGTEESLQSGVWYGAIGSDTKWRADEYNEDWVSIRLPASHPAYAVIAWNAAHHDQPPFFPWGANAEPPDWYDSGVLLADGTVWQNTVTWGLEQGNKRRVIGYRRAAPRQPPSPAPLDEAAQAAEDWTVRAVALLTTLKAANPVHYPRSVLAWLDEATNIANLPSFPKAVDPLLIEAREQEAASCDANGFPDRAADVRAGKCDDDGPVRCRLEGMRRGIEIGERKA